MHRGTNRQTTVLVPAAVRENLKGKKEKWPVTEPDHSKSALSGRDWS